MPTILTGNHPLIAQIAGLLANDALAITNKNAFFFHLGLAREHLPTTTVLRDFFHQTLQAYVAGNPRPTLEAIIRVLRELRLINCAARLRSHRILQVATILELQGNGIVVHPQPMIEILEQIGDIPFISICINGPMRCGKSFLVSSIIANITTELNGGTDWVHELRENFEEFFEWRKGIEESVTKGVNIWKTPTILRQTNGSPFGIILMDAQGEFDPDQDESQSGLIFAFTSIIASTNIYNLNSTALNRLSAEPFRLFLHNMSSIAAQTCPREGQFLQRFVLLVRDVPESVYPPGLYTSGNRQPEGAGSNFFTTVFRPNGFMGECTNDINEIFREMSLFALPDPGVNLKNDSLDNIHPPFKAKVREFYKFLINKREPLLKKANGNTITGRGYIPIFQEFARDINEMEIPQLDGLFTSYLRGKLVAKVHDLLADFKSGVCNDIDSSENGLASSEFLGMFDTKRRNVLVQFDALNIGTPPLKLEYRASLQRGIEDSFLQLSENNRLKFESGFTRVIMQSGVVLDRAMEAVIAVRQQLTSVDYNSYIRRWVQTIHRGGQGSRELDEAEFNAPNYNKVVNELKDAIRANEEQYRLVVDEFDQRIQGFNRLRALKSLLDKARENFTNFDLSKYDISQSFVRHGNTKIFGNYLSALYGSCTVFDVARYATETNFVLKNLREIEGRYRDAVASGVLD